MQEIWKDIVGYEGLYQVSNFGRIKSNNYLKNNKPFIRKLFIDKENYAYIILKKQKKQKRFAVHRLVAEAFVPNPNNLPQINHKDENPSNNIVDNLEWCTSKYNCNYGTRNFRMSKSLSKKVYQYTLDNKLIKIWNSVNEASKFYNNWHISSCCLSKRKTACGYIWRYAD